MLLTLVWDTFDLVVSKVILGSFGALVATTPVPVLNLKTAGQREKQIEINDLGTRVQKTYGRSLTSMWSVLF